MPPTKNIDEAKIDDSFTYFGVPRKCRTENREILIFKLLKP